MKNVFIATVKHDEKKETTIIGAFSSRELAYKAIDKAIKKMGQNYKFYVYANTIDLGMLYGDEDIFDHTKDSDVYLSIEEQIEAVKHYLNIAQKKVVKLENMYFDDLKIDAKYKNPRKPQL